jgi:transposase-like protein
LLAGETVAALAREWRVSERTLSKLVNRHRGDKQSPTLPGGRGKPKRRGRLVATADELVEAAHRQEIEQRQEDTIKIGAKVVAHAKYVTFQLAEVAVPRKLFAQILERIARLCPACASG